MARRGATRSGRATVAVVALRIAVTVVDDHEDPGMLSHSAAAYGAKSCRLPADEPCTCAARRRRGPERLAMPNLTARSHPDVLD